MNPDQAIINVGGSKEVYRELLATFVDSDSMSEAQQYYEARDLENYRITVHGLKSSARYVGADRLSDKAKELEDYSKNGDWDAIDREHPNIIPMYRTVETSIRNLLGGADTASDNKADENLISIEDLRTRLKDLKSSLSDMDFDNASDIAAGLKKMSCGDDIIDTDVWDVVRMVENFDFEDAENNIAPHT